MEGQRAAAFQTKSALQNMKDMGMGTNSQRYQDLNARQMRGENLSEADRNFMANAERYSNLEARQNAGSSLENRQHKMR